MDQILLNGVWESVKFSSNSQAPIKVSEPMGLSHYQESPYARYELEIKTNNLLIPHGVYKVKINSEYTYCDIKVYKGDTAWGDIANEPK